MAAILHTIFSNTISLIFEYFVSNFTEGSNWQLNRRQAITWTNGVKSMQPVKREYVELSFDDAVMVYVKLWWRWSIGSKCKLNLKYVQTLFYERFSTFVNKVSTKRCFRAYCVRISEPKCSTKIHPPTLKRKCHYFDKKNFISWAGCGHFHNFGLSQWRKFCQRDGILFAWTVLFKGL